MDLMDNRVKKAQLVIPELGDPPELRANRVSMELMAFQVQRERTE